MPDKEIIHVVAGNIAEYKHYVDMKFKEWKEKENLEVDNPHDIFPEYKYVYSRDNIRGLSKIKGFYYGSYKQRTDYDDIKLAIDVIKSRMLLEEQISIAEATKNINQPNPMNRHKKDFTVRIEGIETTQYELEYVLETNHSWKFKLLQAPPAGAELTIMDQFLTKKVFTCNGTLNVFYF